MDKNKDFEILILTDLEEIARVSAEKFVKLSQRAIAENGKFTVALSGGSTPRRFFQLLADENDKFRASVDWENCFFFLGDERNVLRDDAQSNFRQANETLFQPLKLSEHNFFRYQTELGAEKAAENYDLILRDFFALQTGEIPRFDLIFLGLGTDGHTASLFPQTDVLHETEKFVAAQFVKKLNSFRLTFTTNLINNAAQIIFQVSGAEKAEVLQEILNGENNSEKFPAQLIAPKDGKLLWLIDDKANQK